MQQGVEQVSSNKRPSRKADNRPSYLILGGLGGLIGLLCLAGGYLACTSLGMCGGGGEESNKKAEEIVTREVTQIVTQVVPVTEIVPVTAITSVTNVIPVTAVTEVTVIVPVTAVTVVTEVSPASHPIPPRGPDPFINFPDEYKTIQLPVQMTSLLDQGGVVVPLPNNTGSLQEKITSVAGGVDLSRLDFSRAATFPTSSSDEYIAVPISKEYYQEVISKTNPSQGMFVGVIYDKYGSMAGIPDLYQVWTYDNYTSLVGTKVKAIILETKNAEYVWQPQSTSTDLPLAFFIQGSCHFCWKVDGRCGCLICRNKKK